MRELISRLQDDTAPGAAAGDGDRLCGGTLLSRLQYLIDVRERGYRDARLLPQGAMTQEQIDDWSRRAEEEAAAALPFSKPVAPAEPKIKTTKTRRST
jgi:hypothetical protein